MMEDNFLALTSRLARQPQPDSEVTIKTRS